MHSGTHKNILLGVTGSIAAYKAPELVRLLRKAGYNVRVVLSEGATAFTTPLTLQTLSGHRVYQSLFDCEAEATMSHIELARWADLILLAPATAHLIAKLNHGLADDLLTTLCLATTAPIALVPAMNVVMWSNPVTQKNVDQLKSRNNIFFLGPASGPQACGETGEGRMLEPENIMAEIATVVFPIDQPLKNKKILITAGPTQEAIDPVRYLSNHSSGKMGYAIAAAAVYAGAKVTLISGPTALPTPDKVTRINVTSADEMYDAVMLQLENCDIFIAAAAVADYKVKNSSIDKIKKTRTEINLELIKNPDILATVSKEKPKIFTVGFAAETQHLIEHAKQKLEGKKLDMIVANKVGKNKGFHADENELIVITKNTQTLFAYQTKKQLAKELIRFIASQLQDNYVF